MKHIVLLGDSIFDNENYVPGKLSVIKQLGNKLNEAWDVSLLAVDGAITTDVSEQLKQVPEMTTHFILSCGGNDALCNIGVLNEPVNSVAEAMDRFSEIRNEFKKSYSSMLKNVMDFNIPVAVCSIYDSIPGIEESALTSLSMFNEIILKEAFMANVPVIDLRLIFTETSDYSEISPIEPSVKGGEKMTAVIKSVLENHDFSSNKSIIYC